MKKFILVLIIGLHSFVGFTQNKIANLEGINYQAVAIDTDVKQIAGEDILNKPVYLRDIAVQFIIDQGPTGSVIYYSDEHEVTTDKYGMFNVVIGKGIISNTGTYANLMNVPWINGDQWLKVEISLNNDGEFIEVSHTKLMAVPFAYYSDDISDNSITTYKVVDEALQNVDIDTGAVETSEILDETILAEDIATGAVETSEILDETILAEDIAIGAVETSEILNETILAEDIATGAVESSEILNGTIIEEDLANGAVNLNTKVSGILPVVNGGTGRSSVNSGDILIGNGSATLDTLVVYDSVMLFSNASGSTELYSLTAGLRTFINIDTANKTVEISAIDQSGGPNTGSSQVSVGNVASGTSRIRNFPSTGVQPGDIILATTLQDLSGITLTAYVRQSGQVNVVFFNGTNSTVGLGVVDVQFANFGQP
jgi:hypothetical protein